MTLLFVDCETSSLNPNLGALIEVAYAYETGPIKSFVLKHDLGTASTEALRVNRYYERQLDNPSKVHYADQSDIDAWFDAMRGVTLCGSNVSFDAAFIATWWNLNPFQDAPWHYRSLEIESWAAAKLNWPVGEKVPSTKDIYQAVVAMHHDIPEPDHTAAGDVATIRAIYLALK